eukprot:scaffold13780_cov19-Prasinocladus_malaysianus.AAC.2
MERNANTLSLLNGVEQMKLLRESSALVATAQHINGLFGEAPRVNQSFGNARGKARGAQTCPTLRPSKYGSD